MGSWTKRTINTALVASSAIQDGLNTQVADQEQAAGSIADLQAKIIAAGTRLSEATQARDQAQGQLASVQKELETWRQQQAQGAQQIQTETQELFRARAETQEAEQRRMAALSEITAHPQAGWRCPSPARWEPPEPP